MVKKSLEELIQSMEDVHEIENLLARYAFYHMVGMQKETVELFAQKTPGVRATIVDLGVYEGIEGVRRFYMDQRENLRIDRTGHMGVWPLTTPVIEVAGDGKTAKAVLIAPGALAGRDKEGKLQASWHWVKAAYDLVKEDGQWKFWHFHIHEIFVTPYERSWVEHVRDVPKTGGWAKPDRTGTIDYPYSTTSIQVLAPVPPEPYETFDEKTAY